jgi:hypothetical protein
LKSNLIILKKNLLSDHKFNGFPSETAGKSLILRALAAPAVFKTPAHIEVFLVTPVSVAHRGHVVRNGTLNIVELYPTISNHSIPMISPSNAQYAHRFHAQIDLSDCF